MSRRFASILQINLVILALPLAWLGFSYANYVSGETWSFIRVFTVFGVTIGVIILSEIISSIFHETGHLLGGLLSGYKFGYFGFFEMIWIKENGQLIRKKSNKKGIGGVSRLSPPDMKDGTYPFKLYYFGGTFMNLILAVIFAALFFLLASILPTWSKVFLIISLKGLIDFIMNLVPINNDGILNDGYLLFNLGKEKNADLRLKYWRNLRIQGLITEGVRPKDICESYYKWAHINKKIDDFFTFEAGLLRYKSLMDKELLEDAKKCLKAISSNLDDRLAFNKPILNLELIFHELIGDCVEKDIQKLYTPEVDRFTKETASNESTQRISYAYARLLTKDDSRAKMHLESFIKACGNSVNVGSIPNEKELVKLVDKIADRRAG
jgi:hypothetical protein